MVAVNWNSLDFLSTWLEAVERFTPEPHTTMIIDNNSSDGSKQFLREQVGVSSIFLPFNVGHGPALDLAIRRAQTETVVVLDIDAIPISAAWLSEVLDPLESGAKIAGAHWQRDFIHPCFLAVKRSDYLDCGLTFRRFGYQPTGSRRRTPFFLDVGEAMSQRLMVEYSKAALHRIPVTSTRGPNWIGTVFGDVVYHNFYSTHGQGSTREIAAEAWEEAKNLYLS